LLQAQPARAVTNRFDFRICQISETTKQVCGGARFGYRRTGTNVVSPWDRDVNKESIDKAGARLLDREQQSQPHLQNLGNVDQNS